MSSLNKKIGCIEFIEIPVHQFARNQLRWVKVVEKKSASKMDHVPRVLE